MRVRVSVRVAVGRLAAQKGGWAAASARVAGRASACSVLPPPRPGSYQRGLLLGRENVGALLPKPPGEEWDICVRSGAAGGRLLPWPRADSTNLSSLQIFRRADKNGEFPSQAGP